ESSIKKVIFSFIPSLGMGLWRILCFLIFLGKSWGQEQIYVISAPKVFLVGAPENIVIQGYGYSEAFDATISIKHFPNKYFSYSSGYVHLSKENKFQNATVLTIQPKQFPGGQNLLSYVYLEVISKHFSKLKKIPVTSDNEFLFIQTDKPAYIPHESDHGSATGVYHNQYLLDSVPMHLFSALLRIYGVWTVKASYKEDFSTTGTTYFEIKPHGGFSEEAEVPGIKYILSPYTLNLFATPLFLKPGIPYSIKVKTNVTDLPEENQAGKHYRAIPYSSVSQSYLSIDWTENSKALLVGEYLNITFAAKSPYSHKITHYNYFILSKGKIIQFGTKEKIPGSSYESINIQVTQNMVPSARLLVYYIITGETAELVSDSIVFNIGGKNWTQLQLFHALEKSDLGCGAGGGRDSADVFHRAGLTFITNANVDDSQENDEPCKEILRRKRNLKEKIDEQATKYKYPLLRKCCYDGARHDYESCEKRAERITVGPRCIQAFKECCLLANQIRAEETHKHRYVGGRHFLMEHRHGTYERRLLWQDHMCSDLMSKTTGSQGSLWPCSEIMKMVFGEGHCRSPIQEGRYGLWTIKAKYKEDFTTTGTGSFKVKRPEKIAPQCEPYKQRRTLHYEQCPRELIRNSKGESTTELVSDSVCLNIEEKCGNQLQVFGASGKSDQACGASGGRNNAEVFDAAGLTVLTNANANDSQQTASQFKHPFIQKCCYDGARESEDSCMERAVRITFGPRCIAAFSQCCSLASELRNSSAYKVPILGRAPGMCKSSCSLYSAVGGYQVDFVLPPEVIPNLI
ncbi:Complement C5, partial [Heterocephalus glaber]